MEEVLRDELSLDEAGTMAAALEAAEIVVHSSRPHLRRALALAVELQHPAYDCAYLSLARQLDQPLVTADQRLVAAVRDRGSPELDRLVLALPQLPALL